MEGWIKLYRKMEKHWMWKNPLYLRAWVYCLFRANFEDNKVLIGNEITEVKKGSFLTSIANFSKSTNLSPKQTRLFWKLLEDDFMIVKKTSQKWTQITICNYEDYQGEGQAKGKRRANEGQQKRMLKKEKNIYTLACARDNKGKKIIPPEVLTCIPPEFNNRKFITAWDSDWAKYREGKKLPKYQVPEGLKKTLSALKNKTGGDVDKAIQALHYSMEQNWQGIFIEKKPVNNSKSSKRKHGTMTSGTYDIKQKEIEL